MISLNRNEFVISLNRISDITKSKLMFPDHNITLASNAIRRYKYCETFFFFFREHSIFARKKIFRENNMPRKGRLKFARNCWIEAESGDRT